MTDTSTPTRSTGLATSIGLALAAALVGSVVWLVAVMVTGYLIGFVALGVGLLVGFALNRFGGRQAVLPIIAAVAAIIGVLVGSVLIFIWQITDVSGVSWGTATDLVTSDLGLAWDTYVDGSEPIDFLFYALAAFAAYRFTAAGLAQPASVTPTENDPFAPAPPEATAPAAEETKTEP